MPSPTRFRELARVNIGLNRDAVISLRDDGRYSIAQQVEAATDDEPVHIFLKNALILEEDKLRDLNAAISAALEKGGASRPRE